MAQGPLPSVSVAVSNTISHLRTGSVNLNILPRLPSIASPNLSGRLTPSSSIDDVQPVEDHVASHLAYDLTQFHLTKRVLPCTPCRENKRKCDRKRPSCAHCLVDGFKCEYALSPKKETQAKWRLRLELENHIAAGSSSPKPEYPSPPAMVEEPNAMSVSFLVD
ncbi:hypothetical protein HDU98_002048 [Podochytrium sp. JEL0797]|nr:hypothetical protein HDU98_002048 [Podochytrium sp. JEL0797]